MKKPFIGFEQAESDAFIIPPPYRSNALVAPRHLVQVRMMLDPKGLMDANAFDDPVAAASTDRSAS